MPSKMSASEHAKQAWWTRTLARKFNEYFKRQHEMNKPVEFAFGLYAQGSVPYEPLPPIAYLTEERMQEMMLYFLPE